MVEEKKEKELLSCRNKPYVSERSKEMAKNCNTEGKSVCDRLYHTKVSKNATQEFTPSKKSRDLSKDESEVVGRLYADAQTRKDNLEKLKQPQKPPKLNCSQATDYHLKNKFMKEYNASLIKLNIKAEDPWISFDQMKAIMTEMGFKQNNSLLLKQFNELRTQDNARIDVNQLKGFIAGVLDISLDDKTTPAKAHEQYRSLYLMRKNNQKPELSPKQRRNPVKNLSKSFLEFEENMREHIRRKEEKLIKKRTELELRELEACTFNSVADVQGKKKLIGRNRWKELSTTKSRKKPSHILNKTSKEESIEQAIENIARQNKKMAKEVNSSLKK
eukprot:TRINITY_DN14249_c0_g10_i1.p1 TRINITY_DN14249_c0_g10~~TRINITY_DN14249_c0_g10_i1.p1  ORF type:complete len:331 (-),score=84.70 TRINITY_DN14249_c0_g10_i1:5-997(-)